MNPLVRCACGKVHIAAGQIGDVPLVACGEAPPESGTMWLVDTKYLAPSAIPIPRPEATW